MPDLHRPQLKIDDRTRVAAGGGAPPIESGGASSAPGVGSPPPPGNLTVAAKALAQSGVTPTAVATLQWTPPPNTAIGGYILAWSTSPALQSDGSFVTLGGAESPAADRTSTAIGGLPCGVLVHFQARTVARGGVYGRWGAVVSDLMPIDTTAPGPVLNASAVFTADGTLEVRATPPASSNFKHIRIEVYNGANVTQLDVSQFGGGVWTWSPTRNRQQTLAAGGAGATTSVTIRLYAVSWGNISSSVVTVAAASPVPSIPTGLGHTWTGDPGTAAGDLLVTHNTVAGLAYLLTIDTVERPIPAGRYSYSLAQNAAEHGGAPDPVLLLSLVAENGLGQRSPAATATATNAAPPATTLTVFGAFSTASLTITPSTAQDLRDYRIRAYRNAVLVRVFFTAELRPTYAAEDGDGSYQFDVAARDAFGQIGAPSALTTAATLQDMAAFVATLREGLFFSDHLGTSASTLAGLKDGDLAVNVITYGASATWRWTQGDWQERITHQTSELSLSATAACYVGVSLDGVTWTWFAGGTATGGRWQPVAQASESAAQTAATALTAGVWRIDLPTPRAARYIRLGHRNTVTAYALREFFPSTLLRGTYVQAESITARELAVGAVTANRIAVGALDGATITGALIRTAASGARVELSGADLRSIDSAGRTRVLLNPDGLRTYDSAGNLVIEATTATNGALRAGVGRLVIDRSGLYFVAAATAGSTPSMAVWRTAGGAAFATIDAYYAGSSPAVGGFSVGDTGSGLGALTELDAQGASNPPVKLRLVNTTGLRAFQVSLDNFLSSAPRLELSASAGASISNAGLAVGSGVGSVAAGEVRASSSVFAGTNTNAAYLVSNGPSGVNHGWIIQSGGSTRWAGEAIAASNGDFWLSRFNDAGAYLGTALIASRASHAVSMHTTPDAAIALVVNGASGGTTQYAFAARNNASGNLFWVRNDSYSWFAGTIDVGGLINRSDARLKTAIAPIPDALTVIRAIPAASWAWRDDPTARRRYGPIAQDVQRIAPELVTESEPGPGEQRADGESGMLSVDLGGLVGLLHGAVQQLADRLAALEARHDR